MYRNNLHSSLHSSPERAPSAPRRASPILLAAQSPSVIEAALAYAELGFSVLPLRGKVPALSSWYRYQQTRASPHRIRAWALAGLFHNVGIVCGAVSGGLVVLDLDGEAAYPAFAATFPELTSTYTVATGSGRGKHVYLFTSLLPPSVRALRTPVGNIEVRSTGLQVAAPPSLHPATGKPYIVLHRLDILRVRDLVHVHGWVQAFQQPSVQKMNLIPVGKEYLHPPLISTLTRYFIEAGYRSNGDWLNGPCIYPDQHQHGDAKPSFGFNRRSGYGFCYVCGSMLAKDIANHLELS